MTKRAARKPGRMKPCRGCGKDFYCVASRDVGGNATERVFCDRKCQRLWRERQGPAMFWSKVVKGPGCWGWTGHKRWDGYGRFRLMWKAVFAHRFSYELHKGPIPPGMHVLHSCDNPICTNPDHLRLGTHDDNMKDMWSKRRGYRGGSKPLEAHDGH